ncbi:MAG: ATP-binding cassette domain-containing protein [Psychrobacter sp.]|nr:ATP-binding cassette domain-containing protein [Psychrobacter sp.]
MSTDNDDTILAFEHVKVLTHGSDGQKKRLIQHASGTLLAGQLTVLTGTSGSGKSVLLRVLTGLLPISAGTVRLRPTHEPPHARFWGIQDISPTKWRAQVALLAQHPQLIEGSVLDNLQLPFQLRAHQHLCFDSDWHTAQLAYLGRGGDFLHKDAYHLSGGERQLVNTLRLLQLEPRVLLLDEPTAALDVDTAAQLVALLADWVQKSKQRTVLWVTHDTQDILPLADQHWHMQAGVLTKIR